MGTIAGLPVVDLFPLRCERGVDEMLESGILAGVGMREVVVDRYGTRAVLRMSRKAREPFDWAIPPVDNTIPLDLVKKYECLGTVMLDALLKTMAG